MLAVAVGLGCSSGPKRAAALGEAFVGPATLKLRQDLAPASAEAATVRHGERIEIVQRRRRFVKVRTAQGVEGWTETRQLLAPAQMAELDKLAERAARLPSQGAATAYEAFNVHTEPNRQAPSFAQVREKELVEVLEHRLAPRIPFEPPALLPPTPKVTRRPKRKTKEEIPRLPPPPAPKPPANWLELSRTQAQAAPSAAPAAKPVVLEDWSLIRLRSGRAGWVLQGMLKMNIPDEVAQYSEGHRITAYFSMGQVTDEGEVKHHWLWTTISKGSQPFQFDSFRYFVWSLRRHRYETAYIERNLRGYYPVQVHPVQVGAGARAQTMPGFSVIVEEDGVRYRRTYAYQVYLVRLISKTPLQQAP